MIKCLDFIKQLVTNGEDKYNMLSNLFTAEYKTDQETDTLLIRRTSNSVSQRGRVCYPNQKHNKY